jgi:hypothetical protein
MDEQSTLIEGLELTLPGATVEVAGVSVSADTVLGIIQSGVLELDVLPARELTVVLQLAEIARRRTEATMTRVVECAERMTRYTTDGHRGVRGWVKASARWPNHQARVQSDVGRLIRHHELCRSEYFAGRLGLAQVALLARLACHPRAGKQFAGSEKLLVEDAQRMEYEDFRKVCDHWLNLADLDGADQDEALRHYLRNGCCITDSDGMTHLDAQFAGAQGGFIREVFDRYFKTETEADWDAARNEHGDGASNADLPRTDEQRRADALYAIFVRAASAHPDAKAPEPVVEILIDEDTAETLLARAVGVGVDPIDPRSYRTRRCHDAGGDPVAPADATAAMLIGQLRRVIIDSKSVAIDLGRRSRLFTGSARTAAQLQYWRCTHPGCGVPTKHSQIDHANPWGGGRGTTSQNNADIKCGHHNRFKESGYTTWRTADGIWHTRRPDGTEIRAV